MFRFVVVIAPLMRIRIPQSQIDHTAQFGSLHGITLLQVVQSKLASKISEQLKINEKESTKCNRDDVLSMKMSERAYSKNKQKSMEGKKQGKNEKEQEMKMRSEMKSQTFMNGGERIILRRTGHLHGREVTPALRADVLRSKKATTDFTIVGIEPSSCFLIDLFDSSKQKFSVLNTRF